MNDRTVRNAVHLPSGFPVKPGHRAKERQCLFPPSLSMLTGHRRPQTGGQVTSLYQCSSNINCTPADRGMIPRELPEVHSAASADWWETALFCYHQCVVTEAVIRHHNLNG